MTHDVSKDSVGEHPNLHCSKAPVPHSMSLLYSSNPLDNKRGTSENCEIKEWVSEENTSPNRKKSRVISCKQNKSALESQLKFPLSDSLEDIPECHVSRCLSLSCSSDEDEHSTMNSLEDQQQESDHMSFDVNEKKGLLNKALSPNRQSEESVKTLPSLLNEMVHEGIPRETRNCNTVQEKKTLLNKSSCYKSNDFSNLRHLPPVKENEIEFVIPDFLKLRENGNACDRLFSAKKNYQCVSFRLLVFPRGNKANRLSNVSAYLAVEPYNAFPPHAKKIWHMHHCNYMIVALHFGNWKEQSIVKKEHFSFSSEDVDRGWLDFIPEEALVEGQFISPTGQLILRAQICPRVVVAGNQHLVSRADVGYIGIRNQGATCYLNSLVQALYHIGDFRKSIFNLTKQSDQAYIQSSSKHSLTKTANYNTLEEEKPTQDTDDDVPWTEEEIREALQDEGSQDGSETSGENYANRLKVSLALQELFLKLSSSKSIVSTDDLITSFGWESNESLTQHDAQELNRLLCDRLEEQMKGTLVEGAIERLFMGEFENYVQCIDVPYSSTRRETFYDLQLDVQNTHGLMDSLNKYIQEEVLEGDNLYDAENFGRQRAKKGVRFIRFPPVIQFHLKRFTFDPNRMDMVKINQRFEYPQFLDLSNILPGAGVYELFSVIVHGGDVGGGHYYLLTRPGGKEWWMRFDDEKVYFVSSSSAFEDSYGGRYAVCDDYFETTKDSRYASTLDMSVRLYSAYILFYVHVDQAKELLQEPDANEVNPYLLERIELDEARRRKTLEIKNYVRSSVKVRYITENSLRGYQGFFTSVNNLPCCYEARFPQIMLLLDLWKIITNQIAKEKIQDPLLLQEHKSYHCGLWFFDATSIRPSLCQFDIRPFPCHLSETTKRESTLEDHLNWMSRSLRKPWSPTLSILIHPITLKKKSEIRSVGALQSALTNFKFFIAKIFSPGSSTDPYATDQCLVFAALPPLKVNAQQTRNGQLVELFVECLRTLLQTKKDTFFEQADIEAFIQKAFPLYCSNVSASQIIHEDPLQVAQRVYLEIGNSFEHIPPMNGNNSGMSADLSSLLVLDTNVPPIIVFALPASQEALKLHQEAIACSTRKNLFREKESSLDMFKKSFLSGPKSGESKLPDNESHHFMPNTFSPSFLTTSHCLSSTLPNDSSQHDTNPSPASLCCATCTCGRTVPSCPPHVPFFPSCTPIEWHASLTRFNINITLRLYDPLLIQGRLKDVNGHFLSKETSLPSPILACCCSRYVYEDASPCSTEECATSTSPSLSPHLLDIKSMERCPALAEVNVRVDLRWPHELALRWLCWHLGVNADYCLIHPDPPFSTVETPVFSTYVSPSEAKCLASTFSWSDDKCHYHRNANVTSSLVDSKNPPRLEDLYTYFSQRLNVLQNECQFLGTKCNETPMIFHISLLPRSVNDPSMGFLTSDLLYSDSSLKTLSQSSRLIVVRVFNNKVQNVGSILVEITREKFSHVTQFIDHLKTFISPLMESRGATKQQAYRLVWEGTIQSDTNGMQQINPPPSCLEIVTNKLFHARLPVLMRGFQYASPLRLEPDFSEKVQKDLEISKSLPPLMSLNDQIASPRPLCLTVVHQNSDRVFFGHPFYILISSSDTTKVIKEKIQAKLQVPQEDFIKWKFFWYDYQHTAFIRDDEVPDFSQDISPCLLAIHKYNYAPRERIKAPQLHIK